MSHFQTLALVYLLDELNEITNDARTKRRTERNLSARRDAVERAMTEVLEGPTGQAAFAKRNSVTLEALLQTQSANLN